MSGRSRSPRSRHASTADGTIASVAIAFSTGAELGIDRYIAIMAPIFAMSTVGLLMRLNPAAGERSADYA